MQYFRELRERRLFQIVVAYIGAGWAILEVMDQIVDRGVAPDIAYQIVFIWVVLGVPAALLVGWHHGERGRQRAPLSEIVVLTLLGLMAVGFSGNTVHRGRTNERLAESSKNSLLMRSVAVRYFEDRSAGAEYEHVADGLTEGLITELQQVQGLDVVSRNGVLQFRGTDVPVDSMATLLQVGTIVEGTTEVRGDRLRVTLSVLTGAGDEFQRTTIEHPLAELTSLRQSVVAEAARLLRSWIGEEIRVRSRAEGTTSNAAWALLQQGEKARKDAEAYIRAGDAGAGEMLFARADSLMAAAEAADPEWVDPVVERAAVAYRRARLSLAAPELALSYINSAVAHADRALTLAPNNARALELRGTTNYFYHLVRLQPNATEHERLLQGARADLETAVQYDATLASAHATLSHLYSRESVADAVVAATRAYEQDAWLETADVVLWRLFGGSLELELFNKAQEWCLEGARRFPADYRFINCRLQLMTTPAVVPIPDSAWALLTTQSAMTPGQLAELEAIRGEFMVAGVLARAGISDSARAVLDRAAARITPELDRTNELILPEAYNRLLAGQRERAIELLSRYAVVDPQRFADSRGEVPWWWRGLQDEPRFRRLFGL